MNVLTKSAIVAIAALATTAAPSLAREIAVGQTNPMIVVDGQQFGPGQTGRLTVLATDGNVRYFANGNLHAPLTLNCGTDGDHDIIADVVVAVGLDGRYRIACD